MPYGEMGFRIIIFTFIVFSLVSRICSLCDRECEITDMQLPLVWRLILFFGAPNPFRRKTVIFQSIVVIGGGIAALVTVFSSDFETVRMVQMIYLSTPIFLAAILGVRIRRKYLEGKR